MKSFRDICGPLDPDIAKTIRKNSLRAKFGLDKVLNAVHCTDLPEDGILEVNTYINQNIELTYNKYILKVINLEIKKLSYIYNK